MTDPAAKKIVPVLIGIALTIILLIFLAYISSQRRQHVVLAVPDLQIVSPLSSAAIDSPLTMRFRSTEPLELRDDGWGVRNLHLHARINDVEHMPAAADIQSEDSLYVWILPAVRAGRVTIQLGWADQAHRELSRGASAVAHVTIR
jgi:hypothetical protein